MQLPDVSEPTANVFKLFRAWLLDRKHRRTWLIILDNADDARFLLRPPSASGEQNDRSQAQQSGSSERCLDYLPFCEQGNLLVTSRSEAAALEVVQLDDIIPIGAMDFAHAMALLQQKLGNSVEQTYAEISQLVTELDAMPLAMAQAASYIRQRAPRFSVGAYLKKLASSGKTELGLLNQRVPDLRRDRDAQNCILKTWQISFEHIRELWSSAADLLSLMSFFDRHTIPEALLHLGNYDQDADSIAGSNTGSTGSSSASDIGDQDIATTDSSSDVSAYDLDDDLQILRSYSFVAMTADPATFEMHRLVQLAMQDWLKANDSFERWGTQFMANLDEDFPIGIFENREVCNPLFPHVYAAMGTELHGRDALLMRASILKKGGACCTTTGAYTDSQKMHEQSFRCRNQLLGPEHRLTLSSMRSLGRAFSRLGQYTKAVSIQTEALDRAKCLLGENHEITLQCMQNLSTIYMSMGKLTDAETMQSQALHRWEGIGGQGLGKLVIMQVLALSVSRQGRYDEAEILQDRALVIARELGPEGHPRVLRALQDLAITYAKTERHEQAMRLYSEVFRQRSQVFGSDHPHTLSSMAWLSWSMHKVGRRRSAIKLMRDCAEKGSQKLGPNDPNTMVQYKRLQEWEAEEGFRETSDDQKEHEERYGNVQKDVYATNMHV